MRTLAGLLTALVLVAPASAASDPNCLTTDPPPPDEATRRLSFGITPLTAGSAGAGQLEAKPTDLRAERAALAELRPRRRTLVMRLNRMFWADGVKGIRRYAGIVDRYARWGYESELQVRYHPPEGAEGNIKAWKRYVRRAVGILGRRKSVTALSITNEANFSVSPNTSDGSYEGVRRALIRGISAADAKLKRIGRSDVELGFSFAWRWAPDSDRAFWEELGEVGGKRFHRAVDYVGLQIYPHLVWPPAPIPDRSAGDEVIEALTLLRDCYMPKARLGNAVDLWVSENGYATNLGRSEALQRSELDTTLAELRRYSGTLGLTDYRYFNLRDNNTLGPDLFDAVGLLRDDYGAKPAFTTVRNAIRRMGRRR